MTKIKTYYRRNKDEDSVYYFRIRILKGGEHDITRFIISDSAPFRLERETESNQMNINRIMRYTEIKEDDWAKAYKRFLEHIESTVPASEYGLPF